MAPWLRSVLPSCFSLLLTLPAVADRDETCFNGVDDDLDGLIDCEDPDCGAEAVVGPIDLRVSRYGDGDSVEIHWGGAGPETVVDVLAGALSDLSESGGDCAFDSVYGEFMPSGGSMTDPRAGPGSSWYLLRAHSPCALGDYGSDSLGRERVPDRPCRPPEVLGGCDGGPTPGGVSAWTECDTLGAAEESIHLTNLSDEPLRWLLMSCMSTPRFDRFDWGGWDAIDYDPNCFVCPGVSSWWLELAPGEDTTVAFYWPTLDCGPVDVARAWFVVAETCTAPSVSTALSDCPDARVVSTGPFRIEP